MTPAHIRIGNQTSYRAALEVPFEYAIARGFDAFEWFPDRRPSGEGWDAGDLDASRRFSIRRRAEEVDIALTVHAPMHANPLSDDSGPSLDESIRLADDLGATLLNVHLDRPDSLTRYAEAIALLGRRCASAGIRLAIENTPGDGPDAFNELFAILAQSASVGMCLDIGHANLHPSTRNDYLAFVDRLGPHVPIIHVHAHENRGDRDSHIPLFSGPSATDESGVAGLVARLGRRGFSGCIILEQWPDPPALLDRARDGLSRLLGFDPRERV